LAIFTRTVLSNLHQYVTITKPQISKNVSVGQEPEGQVFHNMVDYLIHKKISQMSYKVHISLIFFV